MKFRALRQLPPAFGLTVCALLTLVQTACGGCDETVKSVRPIMVITPDAITFDTLAIGSSAEQPVNVQNVGRGTLKIASVVVADETDIAVPASRVFVTNCDDSPRTGTDKMSIAPGECTRFAVRFAPKSEQSYSTKIVITSNDSVHETLEIPVNAAGIKAPVGTIRVCVLSPTGGEDEDLCSRLGEDPPVIPTLDFGPVLYQEETVRSVRVYNDGTGPLTFSDVHIESDFPDYALKEPVTAGTYVAPGESLDVQVSVIPDGDHNVTGDLVLVTNDPDHSPLPIPIVAQEEGPCLKVDPASTMDFGTVAVGASRTLTLNLENCGHVTYDMTTLEFVPDVPGSTVYTLPGGNPLVPMAFAPGATHAIDVVYKPVTNHTASDPGDLATFSIRTSYGTRQAIRITGKGSLSCGGQQPTANIRVLNSSNVPINVATTNLPPLTNVTIDGSTSTAAAGWTVSKYDWQLISAPPNNTSTVGTAKQFPFFLELAGDYVIQLVTSAKDVHGNACQSAPAQVTIKVVPPPGVHIELTWPQSYGDLDLHYVGPGGALYQGPSNTPKGDVYWVYSKQTLENTTVIHTGTGNAPDWGKNNQVYPNNTTVDDARIDVDQTWGKGPENINQEKPFDGTYQVMAHVYCNRSCNPFSGSCGNSLGALTAHVRVYIDGVVKFDNTMSMKQRDVWEVASISISNGVATVTPGTKALYKTASSVACSNGGD